MPTFSEVMTEFSNKTFLINVKGNKAEDATTVYEYITKYKIANSQIFDLYGGPKCSDAWSKLDAQIPHFLGNQQNHAPSNML